MFLLVLIAQPEIKSLFGLDRVPEGRLKYARDPGFRKHTSLISKNFEFAIKNINFTEKLAQHFQVSGRRI